ncbi:MAG TPA: Hsp33 family molecular chaperone HslO [Calditerricola sp.]
MGDYAIRGLAGGGQIRLIAARTTELVDEHRRRHGTLPTATAALGRAVTAAALMGLTLKGERDRLTIQVRGDGPLGAIVVDADAKGHVRGYVHNPKVHLPPRANGKLDVAGAVGRNGHLYVIKDLGLREPYRGSVPLVSGELGDDFAYYFAVSEQIPSSVGLGVLVEPEGRVRAAGGFLLQVLPGTEEALVERLERRVAELASVSALIDRGLSPEELAAEVVGEPVEVAEAVPLSFACHCSRDRVKTVLASLGKAELARLVQEQGGAEVTCQFCNEVYRLSAEEVQALADAGEGTTP